MTIFLLLWALVATCLVIALRVVLYVADQAADQQKNAKVYWKERALSGDALVEARDEAIAHMSMEIEALTPKRSAHGRFVSKRDQPEFKKANIWLDGGCAAFEKRGQD